MFPVKFLTICCKGICFGGLIIPLVMAYTKSWQKDSVRHLISFDGLLGSDSPDKRVTTNLYKRTEAVNNPGVTSSGWTGQEDGFVSFFTPDLNTDAVWSINFVLSMLFCFCLGLYLSSGYFLKGETARDNEEFAPFCQEICVDIFRIPIAILPSNSSWCHLQGSDVPFLSKMPQIYLMKVKIKLNL